MSHGSTDTPAPAVEPDNPPTAMLVRLGLGITAAVILMVLGVWVFFEKTVAAELKAKGYDVTSSVPVDR